MYLKLKVCRCSVNNIVSDSNIVVENGDTPLSSFSTTKKSQEISNTKMNDNNKSICLVNKNEDDSQNRFSDKSIKTKVTTYNNINNNKNNVVVENDDVLILKICDLENIIREHKCKAKTKSPVKLIACKAEKCLNDKKKDSIVANVTNSNVSTLFGADSFNSKTTKSIGTQHFSSHNLQKTITATGNHFNSTKQPKNEIIIVSEKFKEQAFKNQKVINGSKRKLFKLMKSQKTNSRSLEDIRQNFKQSSSLINVKFDNNSISLLSNKKVQTDCSSLKKISKSVDNLSVTSDSVLDNVDSVELVFISDNFLNKANKQNIIVVNESKIKNFSIKSSTSVNKIPSKPISSVSSTLGDRYKKKIITLSDEFRQNSIKNKVVVLNEPRKRLKDMKLKRNSSQENSVDDIGNKITSIAFHSYDEEQEDLEKKELHQTHL